MTRENKELLLKDLCARMPYGVKIEHTSGLIGTLNNLTTYQLYDGDNIKDIYCAIDFFGDDDCISVEYFRPYLFPLSSMTEEQYNEFFSYYHNIEMAEVKASGDYLKAAYVGDDAKYSWLNKSHFDYRGLIEKGLALDATGLNIY